MAAEAIEKSHEITWTQFAEFAKATGRNQTHVYRVFLGERVSQPIKDAFQEWFGFPMDATKFAGGKTRRPMWQPAA